MVINANLCYGICNEKIREGHLMQENNLPANTDTIRDHINANLDDIARIYDKEYGLEKMNGIDNAALSYAKQERTRHKLNDDNYFSWLVEEANMPAEIKTQYGQAEEKFVGNKKLEIASNRIPSIPLEELEHILANKKHPRVMWSSERNLITEAEENAFFNPYQCQPEWYGGSAVIDWKLADPPAEYHRKQMRVA